MVASDPDLVEDKYVAGDPGALGRRYGLGAFRKQYDRPVVFSPWWPLTAIAIFLTILLGAWLHGASTPMRPFPANLLVMLMGAIIVFILIYAARPSAARALTERRTGKPLALLYDQGFIMFATKSGEQFVAPWADVDVWHDLEARSTGENSETYINVYTFVNRNTKASLKSPFGPEFHMAVELAIATWQYPVARETYRSGRTCNFGRLSISAKGLHDTRQEATLTWPDLESFKISSTGIVRIRRRGQRRDWASFSMGELSNLAALSRLLGTDAPPTFSFKNHARIP